MNTSWLSVGHVDEVVSEASDGNHIIVADPDLFWGLLLWAKNVDHQGATLVQTRGPKTLSVNNILNDKQTNFWNANCGPGVKSADSAGNLPSIVGAVKDKTNGTLAVSGFTRTAGTGAMPLKAGAFVGLFPNNLVRYYRIVFTSATNYTLSYKEAGEADFHSGVAASINTDTVFQAARAFMLKHYFTGTYAAGDTFTVSADPSAGIVSMPVIFGPDRGKLTAYTVNNVNSLVDSGSVVTGEQFAPAIIKTYTTGAFRLAGYPDGGIHYTGDLFYHNADGEIHCATNDIRDVPRFDWWQTGHF